MIRNRLLRAAAFAVVALLLAACASPTGSSAPDYLLLGEVHDNPHGHRRRLADLQGWIAQGWRPALAMEQFDRERQRDLDRAQMECGDADCVIRMAGGTQWDWRHYRPLIEFALRHRLPLVAANLSRADAAHIMRDGFPAALDVATIAAFGLQAPLPATLFARQKQAIDEGHCGMLPRAMLDGMARAQIARDIWMARTLLDHGRDGIVLIAGNGHVRRDVGVPYWLRSRGVEHVLTVGYLEPASQNQAVFDQIRTIDAHPRPDPCASFKRPAASAASDSKPSR